MLTPEILTPFLDGVQIFTDDERIAEVHVHVLPYYSIEKIYIRVAAFL